MTFTVSRRSLIRAAAAATGAPLLVAATTAADIAHAAPGEAMTAYHGVTGASHQQKFNELSAAGYRMISLSVYGNRADPRYAAVWIRRGGPAWAALHGLDAAGYQARFDQLTRDGFVPVLVSATGPRTNPVFAAVFEKITAPAWIARHGLVDGPAGTDGTLSNVNAWARDHNCVPKTIAIYGGNRDRTYAGVWLPNPGDVKWQAHDMGDGNGYQGWFNAYTAAGLRPAFVDASDSLQYLGVFTDDSVGGWVARHGLDSQQYQQEFDTQLAAGRYPIVVQGGGTGASTRYSAVFAARDLPIPRAFRQTVAAGGSFTGVHAVMRDFMQSRGIRAGQLAVRRNGTLRLSAGYTWAEPGYPETQSDSLMRVASVSKAFTCAAIRSLVQSGQLDLDDEVFPLLDITSVALPGQTKDGRVDDVTVRQCVEHTGGWVRRVAGVDPVFRTRDIARALNLPGRATKRDVARYMYGEPLQYAPGDATTYDAGDRYSNFGYVLLGLVVEQVTGMPFRDYLAQSVLQPLGVDGQVFVGATERAGRRANEVSYDHAEVGSSAVDPWSDALAPVAYGSFLVEAMDSGGGLITTAPAVTRFSSDHAVWGIGGRAPGSARTGSMPGCYSRAESRTDGIDWCYIVNTNTIRDSGATLTELAADLNTAIGAAGI
jgi:CubicO group peptidase (beta-lactamase class C family)